VAKLASLTVIVALTALLPFAVQAQPAQSGGATPQDEITACNNTGAELLSLISRLRAQVASDQRQLAELQAKNAAPPPPIK
jgi:hypothetical protein